MLVQLKQGDLKKLRKKWYDEQNGICPILKCEIPFDRTCVDHQHKLKAELADETGKGICRGCIDRSANALEGKISNNFKRLGLNKYTDLPSFLRNLADYLDENKIQEDTQYIHPNEAPPKPKVKKSSYNKLVKAVNKQQKVPKYTGNLSKNLKALYEKYNLEPEFY
tara:strand:- start:7507 stop:8004 length:498 start_codon:yes stop_codon:yes gene_type:complete